MTAPLRLHFRANVPTDERGPLITAAEFAELICDGKRSARWIAQRFGPKIGKKPGREWLFYESDARKAWADYLDRRAER